MPKCKLDDTQTLCKNLKILTGNFEELQENGQTDREYFHWTFTCGSKK